MSHHLWFPHAAFLQIGCRLFLDFKRWGWLSMSNIEPTKLNPILPTILVCTLPFFNVKFDVASTIFPLPLPFGSFKLSWWSGIYIACFATLSFPLIPMCAGTLHSMICLSCFWSSAKMSYIRFFFIVFDGLHRALRVCILRILCGSSLMFFLLLLFWLCEWRLLQTEPLYWG